jgi:hypothetical protein
VSQGQAVPLDIGGLVTGRVGPFTIGALNIESGRQTLTGAPATSFSVVRVKRDILHRGLEQFERQRTDTRTNVQQEAIDVPGAHEAVAQETRGGARAFREVALEIASGNFLGKLPLGGAFETPTRTVHDVRVPKR